MKKNSIIFLLVVGLFVVFVSTSRETKAVLDCYTEIDPVYKSVDTEALLHINSAKDAQNIRDNIIGFLWGKSSKLPSTMPSDVRLNIPVPSYIDISEMTNLDHIDQYTINMENGIKSIVYRLHPKKSNDKLVIVHQGHSQNLKDAGIGAMIRDLSNEGYSVLAFHMPLYGPNTPPTNIKTHADFEKLETDLLNPMKFFIEPVVVALNYEFDHYKYSKTYMTGLSGGGWTTVMVSAIDTRINWSFPVAGSWPLYLRTAPCTNTSSNGDYEQGKVTSARVADFFANTASYLDIYLLGVYGGGNNGRNGIGRIQMPVYNQYDACCFYGISYQTFEGTIANRIKKLRLGKYQIILDSTHKEHKISDWARTNILSIMKQG